ncbi:hypothetical protein BK133_00925 [Paenibacillus sp. FSL H8-0548]|uniref:hypothetical protein n=1 Tax=Paenibacillus sp. FSL H8-0548 TaxID=1920422 RepID=UPI00096F65EA|nr:hypothetical protein [Paenibacillus sp. FSL H8-0548]OMF38797.1 hypothetical protein BK133_00925 [Paenibacillus sp. FSL H8-0548]
MAERRMFSKSIIDSDLFLDMPSSTQNLYFHLAMRGDDDGFVNSPQKIMRMVSCSKNDMDMLVFKNFIIPFDTGICVIKHWRIHNYIRNDRYTPTIYTEEKTQLMFDDSKSYTFGTTLGIPDDIPLVDVGKVSIGKDSIGEISIDKSTTEIGQPSGNPKQSKFVHPKLEEVKAYCEERTNGVDAEKWFDHYTSNGWKVGKNQMKDWKAAVRTWERNYSSSGSSEVGKTGMAAYRNGGNHHEVDGRGNKNPNAGIDFGF